MRATLSNIHAQRLGSDFLVGVRTDGEFVLHFLLALHLARVFRSMMSLRQRIESFELFALLLPLQLAGSRLPGLRRDGVALCFDGVIETIQELLVVVPFARVDAALRRFLDACCVLVSAFLEHLQFGLGIALVGDQASEVARGLVGTRLHQFEDGL